MTLIVVLCNVFVLSRAGVISSDTALYPSGAVPCVHPHVQLCSGEMERKRKRQREEGMHKASIEGMRKAVRPVAEEKRTAQMGGKSRGKRRVE